MAEHGLRLAGSCAGGVENRLTYFFKRGNSRASGMPISITLRTPRWQCKQSVSDRTRFATSWSTGGATRQRSWPTNRAGSFIAACTRSLPPTCMMTHASSCTRSPDLVNRSKSSSHCSARLALLESSVARFSDGHWSASPTSSGHDRTVDCRIQESPKISSRHGGLRGQQRRMHGPTDMQGLGSQSKPGIRACGA